MFLLDNDSELRVFYSDEFHHEPATQNLINELEKAKAQSSPLYLGVVNTQGMYVNGHQVSTPYEHVDSEKIIAWRVGLKTGQTNRNPM